MLWTGRKKERTSQQGDAEQGMDADDQPYEWRKQEYDQACRPPHILPPQQCAAQQPVLQSRCW